MAHWAQTHGDVVAIDDGQTTLPQTEPLGAMPGMAAKAMQWLGWNAGAKR